MERPPERGRRLPRLLLLLLCGALAGCVSAGFGVPPDRARLSALRRGDATTADLLLALGEPNGRGAARLAPSAPRLDVWVYDYTRVQGIASQRTEFETLLVFVRDGRYDGYLRLPGRLDAPSH